MQKLLLGGGICLSWPDGQAASKEQELLVNG
jgi:hypothetical protein